MLLLFLSIMCKCKYCSFYSLTHSSYNVQHHHHTYISNAPITLLDKNIGAVQSSQNGKKTKQSMVKYRPTPKPKT